MYKVSLFNVGIETVIHYPTADPDAPHLLKMDRQMKAGQVSNFNFTIPYMNPGYNQINDMLTTVKAIILETGEIVFEGRIILSPEQMTSSGEFYKVVTCESELAYLNDTKVRVWDVSESTEAFITRVINNHNAHTSVDKQFEVGNIEYTNTITCKTNYENSGNCIIDKVVNIVGEGYLNIRKEDGIRYLDYIPFLPGSSGDINLGENMKDMIVGKDFTNIASKVIPLGKDNLTIESVNNGLDYLVNPDVEGYGLEQTLEFKDITDPTELMQKAQAKLPDMAKPLYKLEVTALDLQKIGLNIRSFYEGTDVKVNNPVMNFSDTFPIIEKDEDMLSPQNSKIILDNRFEAMSLRQIALQRTAQYVNKILSADNQVNTFYLDGYIDLLKNQMGAMADTAEKQLAKAILFEDKVPGSPTYGAMALGTQGFMIASEIVNGDWDWRTFGTGKGFTADLMVLGHLIGGNVNFNLNEGTLRIGNSDTDYKMLFDGSNLNLVDTPIKVGHSDGSYSQINTDGFKRHVGSTDKDYHYLTYICQGQLNFNGSGNAEVWIYLPDEFKGKYPDIYPALSSVSSSDGSNGINAASVWFSSWDSVNARFLLYGTLITTNGSGWYYNGQVIATITATV